MAQTVKRLPAMWETWFQSLDRDDLLGKEIGTHSSTLVWKIPWMKEPGRLQSMGLQELDTTEQLHYGPNIPDSYSVLLFTASDYFHHWSHPQLGVVFALAPSLHSLWSYFSTDLQ